MTFNSDNPIFNLAAEVVNYTSQNLFLTGKAGTGKTTFLRYIKETTSKCTVVIAPTGVAAINAGGVTMHSFFQLPFNPFLPDETRIFGNSATVDRLSLIRNMKMSREKIDLMNELELLIIDEVSMLRADMLDAIDEILRYYRNKRKVPFGGVQVLFIGDLFQLPPVVGDDEWAMLKGYYASPFFFSAKVLHENPPVFIELKTIYRQSEERFINLLNNIRNNTMEDEDYEWLHNRYRPAAMDEYEGTITLTTHNRIADQINQQELQKLDGETHSFMGEIKGEFSDKALPTEMRLDLKVGTQVMFIKNDTEDKKYFNGKLATVTKISKDGITVLGNEDKEEMVVNKEKWSNIRYNLNRETNRIEEDEIGSFTQYPLRLAWAITIHKSQGLTFDNVIIDAGASFAAGQVYVALSRCRTLDGIVLLSKIFPQSVKSDERILQFSKQENKATEVSRILAEEKPKFAAMVLLKTFDWAKLFGELKHFQELTKTKKLPEPELFEQIISVMLEKANAQYETADKFLLQLQNILGQDTMDSQMLNERVTKAKSYFAKVLHDEIIQPINNIQFNLKGKKQVKKYLTITNELENFVWKKLREVERVSFGDLSFEVKGIEKTTVLPVVERNAKEPRGSSQLETLTLYKAGMKIPEIALTRGFAESTIEGHLAQFVGTGEVDVFDFITTEQLLKIKQAADQTEQLGTSPVKAKLNDETTHSQIRMAINYLKWKKEKAESVS
ncbi:MAG: hypothetical protein EXR21_04025 [Flavobacteriaceae bacterium]|nr:hypothetical protein [Flavobacteriaceae bacterium]